MYHSTPPADALKEAVLADENVQTAVADWRAARDAVTAFKEKQPDHNAPLAFNAPGAEGSRLMYLQDKRLPALRDLQDVVADALEKQGIESPREKEIFNIILSEATAHKPDITVKANITPLKPTGREV